MNPHHNDNGFMIEAGADTGFSLGVHGGVEDHYVRAHTIISRARSSLRPVSSEIYAVAKFMTSAKFMTLTLTLTLSLAKYLTSKYLTHAQIAQ